MGSRPFASTRHKRDGHGADKETQRLPHFRPGPDEWLPLPSGPWASAERLMRRNRLVCFGPTVQSRRIYCFRCAGYPLELSLQKPAFLRNTSQRVMTRRFPLVGNAGCRLVYFPSIGTIRLWRTNREGLDVFWESRICESTVFWKAASSSSGSTKRKDLRSTMASRKQVFRS